MSSLYYLDVSGWRAQHLYSSIPIFEQTAEKLKLFEANVYFAACVGSS